MRAPTAVRQSLGRRLLVAAAVCGTLALAIGATTAIFAVVDGVVLRPLPYPAADRLVAVYESSAAARQATALVAPQRLEDWNGATRSFDGLAGSYFENLTDTTRAEPVRVEAMRVSPRFFRVLAAQPLIGRAFTPEEERFGGPSTVVLAERFWRTHYGADPSVVGRALTLGGVDRVVVGVMPDTVDHPTPTTDAWVPAQAPALLLKAREARFYTAFGRLKPGVDIATAQADLAAVQARLAIQFPRTDAGWTATIVPLKEVKIGRVRATLWLLFGAVLLLLAAACANIACVMLADAVRREGELAIRLAVGATPAQIVRMLGVDGACLGAAGGTLGLILASAGLSTVRDYLATLPRAAAIHLDVRAVVFTIAMTVAAALLFAVVPAAYTARRLVVWGRAGPGRSTVGRRGIQHALVTTQVALAVVLLSSAGLFMRTFARLQSTSPGFDPHDVLSFRVSAQWNEQPEAVANRQLRIVQALREVPGVGDAALGTVLPASVAIPPAEFRIAGRDAGEHLFAPERSVSAGYFATLRIPMLQGSTCVDDPSRPFVEIVVTHAWAKRFLPGENPIGRSIERLSPAGLRQRIVGVVGNVREDGLAREPPPLIYTCGLQPYWPDPFFLVRTNNGTTVAMIRSAIARIEPRRAIYAVRPLDDVARDGLMEPRVNAALLSIVATTALLLATLGLYGVLAQTVAARRREIGIRMALGAQAGDVIATVAWPAAATTLIGAAVGTGASLALARILRAFVAGVSFGDPLAFAAAPLLLACAAAAAALIPARRAAQVDPATELRQE